MLCPQNDCSCAAPITLGENFGPWESSTIEGVGTHYSKCQCVKFAKWSLRVSVGISLTEDGDMFPRSYDKLQLASSSCSCEGARTSLTIYGNIFPRPIFCVLVAPSRAISDVVTGHSGSLRVPRKTQNTPGIPAVLRTGDNLEIPYLPQFFT